MINLKLALVAGLAMAGAAGSALAQAPAAAPTPNDYAKVETWLCRPDKADGACHSDQSATEIASDGSAKPTAFARPAAAAFDCFYVYPTASEDPTPNSDMIPGRETGVATAQFGRYGAVCRQFAPMYRSVTLAALNSTSAGKPRANIDRNLNYNDVVDAWNWYLKNENKGRPVLLVGHSQGSGLLTRLVQNEIEGKPVAKLIIAVHQPGTTVLVPPGKDVGGTYKSTPLCRKADQSGCIVVYSSFRITNPPSIMPVARFAHAKDGNVASCTNPAALAGGKAPLDLYQAAATVQGAKAPITTAYARLPGAITGECVTKGDYTYLEIVIANQDATARKVAVRGDIGNPPDPAWGMHNGDMSLPIGDLVKLAGQQYAAWVKANGKK
jgi:hypothetical protein